MSSTEGSPPTGPADGDVPSGAPLGGAPAAAPSPPYSSPGAVYPPYPGYPTPGYPASGYPASGYPAPGYPAAGYGPYPGYALGQDHPQGVIVLILGILGIVTCQVLGPVAWIMGNRALAEIDANPTAYKNRGLVSAGRICGIVGSALLGLYLVFGVIWVIALASMAATGSS